MSARLIRVAAREQLPCVHPENPEIAGVSIVQIAEPWRGVGEVTRNAVVVAPGRLDRSATGTGLSARMAVLHARGLMAVGDAMTHASPIGSTFDGRIVAETTVGEPPRDRAGDPRQRLDHRHHAGLRRPRRSVSGGLPPVGHLAGRRRAVVAIVGQLALLCLAMSALLVAAALFASMLRLASPIAYLLATNLIAWAILVAAVLPLSPVHAVTARPPGRGPDPWIAALSWWRSGRPTGATDATAASGRLSATRWVLGVIAGIATLYVTALAVATPENEGDALAYHVARAAFWYQQHGVGYIANAVETRLNVNPPNAEIGVLFTCSRPGRSDSLASSRSDRCSSVSSRRRHCAADRCTTCGGALGRPARRHVPGDHDAGPDGAERPRGRSLPG